MGSSREVCKVWTESWAQNKHPLGWGYGYMSFLAIVSLVNRQYPMAPTGPTRLSHWNTAGSPVAHLDTDCRSLSQVVLKVTNEKCVRGAFDTDTPTCLHQ